MEKCKINVLGTDYRIIPKELKNADFNLKRMVISHAKTILYEQRPMESSLCFAP